MRSISQPSDKILNDLIKTDYINTKYEKNLFKNTKKINSTPIRVLSSKNKHKNKRNNHHIRSVSVSTDNTNIKLKEFKKEKKNKLKKGRTLSDEVNKINKMNKINTKRYLSWKQQKQIERMSTFKVRKKACDFNLYNINIKPGKRYRLIDGRIGIAKYKGKVSFVNGTETYIGMLIEHGKGENDGTVCGKMYFRCPWPKGDFVRTYAIVEDLGSYFNPITKDMINNGNSLCQEAKLKLCEYKKKNGLK